MSKKNQVIGYLPDERPPFFKLLLYAIQQVIVMFPATVTVALLTGFHISTTIFASGLATLCFLLITGKKLPLYYGSSFSYLAAIGSLMASEALVGASLDEKIAVALSCLASSPSPLASSSTALGKTLWKRHCLPALPAPSP